MAEYLREWLKMILYADVLLCLCNMLLDKTKYEKYIRFFSGFMMLSCLIQPVLSLSSAQDYLDSSWLRSSLKSEIAAIKDSDSFDGVKETVLDHYEDILKKQVIRMGESCGIEVDRVKVYWSDSGEEVSALKIAGERIEDGEKDFDVLEFQQSLAHIYQIEESDIILDLDG